MFIVVVEFTVYPEHASDFRQRVQQQAADSLERETDCHVFDVCIDSQRDDFVLLYEVYSSAGAFDEHLQSEHFVDFNAAVTPWVSDKKIFTYERL